MKALLVRLLFASIVIIPLGACTVFPEQPAHQLFQLPTPKASTITSAASIDTILRVPTPLAVAPTDSARILVKPGEHEIRAYEGARWSNRAPVLVGNYLVESFRRDGRVATVVTDTSPARSSLTLAGDLTRFEAEYDNGIPVIQVQLNLQLIDERSRETLASKRFSISHPAAGETVEEVVQAFGRASEQLAQSVVGWTVEQL